MRYFVLKTLLCLIALCGLTPCPADAGQYQLGYPRRAPKDTGPAPRTDAYSLEDVMKSPKTYLEREVMFFCRYATTAGLFKPINTRFNENSHVNIAVWPDKAVLWTEEGRKDILPTLYIPKNEPGLLEGLRRAKKYELIAVTGRVLNTYGGYPWILVGKMEFLEHSTELLNEQVIEHMQAGHESLNAGAGGAAARHFEQALRFGLPNEYRDTAYQQLAQAYLLENIPDRARDSLRQAVEMNWKDPVPHLALADVCVQMNDPEEAVKHATIALELSGKYPQAYGIRGEALSLMGDYGRAFTELNTAAGTPGITPREKAIISLRRARIYARSDRAADAARLYAGLSEPGEALSADADVHNEIGLFYEKLFLQSGDERYLESASAAFGEAAALATLDPVFLYNQAEAEFRRQDMPKVREIVEKIFRIDPDYAPARLLLGRVHYTQGDPEEAEAVYQSVAPQLGEDAMALLALAEAYLDLARFDDALVAVRAARGAQPWNTRLQALGEHIETMAAEKMRGVSEEAVVEVVEAEADDDASAMREPSGVESTGRARLPMTRVTLPERIAKPDQPGVEREASVDSEGYIQFGMRGVTAGYASLPAPSGKPAVFADGERVRIPPVFTFEPDDSPVIIADVRSRPVPGRKHLVRNANLYKRQGNGRRRPAEIIEHDPNLDAAAMVGPAGSVRAPRAEVRLPSSSQGIGMSEE